jgi:transposase
LTDQQKQRVKRWILGKDPRQYGFDFGLWTRRIVQQLIQEKMKVELCLTSVGKLLASLNITPQKPLRRAYERDPILVQLWLDETYPKLKKRAKKLGAHIFFLDEAGFQSDPPLGRTYGLKGETPVVKTSGQRQSINVISAVNARGAFWAVTYEGKLNAESFVLFLQNFMKGRQGTVFLVVDGHPSHTAKAAQRYVESLGGRLELHRLPSYAPDLNPDEFAWSYMKNNGVSKKPLKQNESLRDRVEEDLLKIKADPRLVRSFFCAPSVAYAND